MKSLLFLLGTLIVLILVLCIHQEGIVFAQDQSIIGRAQDFYKKYKNHFLWIIGNNEKYDIAQCNFYID
jgi:hypothetical protein